MHICLKGRPVTKKNSSRIIPMRDRFRLLPSRAYELYERDCLAQISRPPFAINQPVNLSCAYFMPTHHRVDLANLIEATQDILVKAGVLADDNSCVVVSLDGCRVRYDKRDPRVEIDITEIWE